MPLRVWSSSRPAVLMSTGPLGSGGSGGEDLLRIRVNEQGGLGLHLPVPHIAISREGGDGQVQQDEDAEKKRKKAASFHRRPALGGDGVVRARRRQGRVPVEQQQRRQKGRRKKSGEFSYHSPQKYGILLTDGAPVRSPSTEPKGPLASR